MNLFDIICIFIIGYSVGGMRAYYKMRHIIYDVAKREGITIDDDLVEEKKPQIKKLEVEQINDIMYLYERDTRDFICQANNIEDLAKLAKEYKNIIAATVVYNDRVYMFFNGNSKEYGGQKNEG
jgi:hypothetical protein